jgi:hypothetical protein
VLVILAVAGAILALYYVPKMWVPVCPPGKEGLPPKICFDIENEPRRTLAYIMGGLLAVIGIYMAHRRIRALESQVQIGQEQLQVAQEGQITERFTRAIEQLGSAEMAIRLGGIYALERIANDSDKDYWPIIETLTAYVRENAPWGEPTSEAAATAPKPATDIQAILTVLGRRKYRYEQGENEPLNLRNTYLRSAGLRGAHLERGLLMRAHLGQADLMEAHLEGACFIATDLTGANLVRAHLEQCVLWNARLEGADLSEATGLTREQLGKAIIDEKTILPDYLQEELPEAKGPGGNDEE